MPSSDPTEGRFVSDSREDTDAPLSLPPAVAEWLDERAAAMDLDREALLVQLLDSYRAAETLGGDLDDPIEDAVDERLATAADSMQADLEAQIDDLEREFQSKIVDVRERVIQVKNEADGKADAEHSHEELAEVDTLATVVEALEDSVDELEDRHEQATAELREDLESGLERAAEERTDIDDRLTDATDKLRRVAWVVSDLKDDVGADDAHDKAVDRIKRAAAQEGVETASCESCGESVNLGLLTAPECPHCEATVSDVRPTGGIFRKKARLVAAAQLESGDEGDGS